MTAPAAGHADLDVPALCPSCYAALLMRVRAERAVLDALWCPHRSALAIVQCLGGHIVRWTLQGPLTEAQAGEQALDAFAQVDERYREIAARAVAAGTMN